MLQRERSGAVEMTVTVVEMMVIPMKCSSMTVTMATISPLLEGISPTVSQPAGELFSLGGFRLVEAAALFLVQPPYLRFSGGSSTRRGAARRGPGRPPHVVARQAREPRQPLRWAPCGPPGSPLLASFVIWKVKTFGILLFVF